ncbi:MAG: S-methyl-5-thioribose-1-phosphate isomerase [Chloroflexi bacterium]|nr:S-methyl-5-thioribose-1-phosphate isomerase [Chloroflexota bacterium]
MPTGFRTPFRFESDAVLLVIDQRALPETLIEIPVRSAQEGARVIRSMAVRGAPAIGQVAAISMALSGWLARNAPSPSRRTLMATAAQALTLARPTAVNLGWAVRRVLARHEAADAAGASGLEAATAMRDEAERIVAEATDDHGRLAEAGLAALPEVGDREIRILTHCNTGPLACGQFGTALGIVQAAHHAGRPVHVWVDETRPYLQGARLTAWELDQAGVPHTLIPDVAAGSLMAAGEVDAILVGADRVAANGDTANKVGTYALAVLAGHHGIPFYVCAPLSSVDLATRDGLAIPIEERPADEVTVIRGQRIAPLGTVVRNPSFDVTPAALISGIVTDEGVLRAPFGPALEAAMARREARRAGTDAAAGAATQEAGGPVAGLPSTPTAAATAAPGSVQ